MKIHKVFYRKAEKSFEFPVTKCKTASAAFAGISPKTCPALSLFLPDDSTSAMLPSQHFLANGRMSGRTQHSVVRLTMI
ncbi:MAG: hypothetical protein A2W93_07200 [Bacteroidetes bacterium GWF2_43_63]|nr:MAG: hypothetical protein A2W94_15270 [Bacteroidetes bacterium GWE2_42_42]OFY54015.1 MAG: hypothetical protein A2W93_07200 [Bacteroidetes bacterium GWF2_43_63]HCB63577.1 hypothetical protein [Bacteroidales bacterium]HCY23177.1 hypothetical protein [Bacteroidales bacterium]